MNLGDTYRVGCEERRWCLGGYTIRMFRLEYGAQ
jgi:hypothetical protein